MKTINTIIVVTILVIALMHLRFYDTATDTIAPVSEQDIVLPEKAFIIYF